jgi:hypothetical protein
MHWLTWWLGVPGVVLGFVGLALLLRRVLRNAADPALALVLVLLGTTAVVLARPSITPDHPWADRRFVPVVIPGLVIAATWLVAWLVRRTRTRNGAVVVAVLGTAALIAGPGLGSAHLWGHPTERGEIALVQHTCDALPPHAAVIIAGARAHDELTQVLRHGCDVVVAVAPTVAPQQVVRQAAAAARANGFTPVVLAESEQDAATASGAIPRQVATLGTREDGRTLVRRPTTTRFLGFEVWLAQPR